MSKDYDKSDTGAMREALGLIYKRQVPLEAIMAGAIGLEYGAQKYDNRNWEKGLPWQQLIDSTQRHLDAIALREKYDAGDSELPHHILFMSSAMMLVASMIREIGDDNRLPAPDKRAMTPKDLAKWATEVLNDAEESRREGKGYGNNVQLLNE